MTTVLKDKGERQLEFNPDRLVAFIEKGLENLVVPASSKDAYIKKVLRLITKRETIEAKDIRKILIQSALVLTNDIKDDEGYVTQEALLNINWNRFARYVLQQELYKRASKNRSYDSAVKYGDFYGLVKTLTEKKHYTPDLLANYSREELIQAGQAIVPERDELLDFAGLYSIKERYLVKDFDKSIYELPQERFMIAALHLMMPETENRIEKVIELYWAVSNLYITLATPTLTNAGRFTGGLSSCFVLTSADSLRSIYDDNTDIATFSKNGAGIGIYIGKLRATGSSIRGFKNASSGTIGWIKQLDNTAVSVDQLGQRKGAIAIYQDMWHKDILGFMDLRLNTGDKSKRAYNVFTGLCIPDEFMRQVNKRGDFFLFDPHEIREVMGFSLEDFYDKKKLGDKETPNPTDHAWTYHYYLCVDNNELSKQRIPAIELFKKAMQNQLETGIPYMFYRDSANRDNTQSHVGMIYCSNLCSEISQNQSPSEVQQEVINWETGEVIIHKSIGDLVTCNLSSLVVNNVVRDGVLERVIMIQMRALDNVISLLKVPVPQAQYTNVKYRAVGAGEQGIAALLAAEKIMWDSEEAVEYIAKLEEEIMMYTIKASALLGKEKGSYPVYEGSQWNTGEWFEVRNLETEEWLEVKELATKFMRNAYLRAIAPTGSTSVIAGSTPGIDPIFDVVYFERKKDYQLPIVVPNLNPQTWFYYKPTMKMEYDGEKELAHLWAIRHGEVRQTFVDQAISHNFYLPQGIKAKNFLRLHMENWERGVKTSYYTRSWDKKQEDTCLACSS
ncbi:ribonucleoside-diphosphate reductase subunit alpha [Priestia aryabhattai]|uniref:ribonucleoside-diphosphate reductase subunit alpha n=1 Tax=Priestia aryabhattai TaxID=412384 RepID=UPI002E1F53E6|nr:ribonucleoside-diphosphate reductase subunit alpha [Priestia aryabhattai]MED4262002.1 ribonucleoside-diphosphate reductase subunit alpha [Priestia aryabhattai]